MEKKDLAEKDFLILINAEKIAYYVYDYFIKEKCKNEYVDLIASSYTNIEPDDELFIETLSRANLVLERDYNIDMLSLPFAYENLKVEIIEYELENKEISFSI